MLLVVTSGCRSGPMTNRTSGTVWSRRQYGACRLALGRLGCEFKKASSFTSRLRRCSIRCRARSDLFAVSRHTLGAAQVHGHGLVTPPVLGAVQVGVHGLADRVRDGVLLGVLRGLRPCEHAVQIPASVQMTVVVPRLQFIDKVGHCSFASVTGFLLVQTVQKTVVVRLCSSLARSFLPLFATTGAMVRQCCPVVVPLLWLSRQFLWSSVSFRSSTAVKISTVTQRPLWCRRCSCGYGRRCVHAATVSSTVEVPQIPFIARVCGRFVVLRDGYATFSSCVMVVMKGFLTHFASFFALLRLSRS